MALLPLLGATCQPVTGRNTTPVSPQPAPAPAATPPGAVRFAVIGDYGNDSQAEADVAALVKGWDPEFVVTTGDNNYNFGLALTIDDNIGKHYASFIGNYRGSHGKGAEDNRFWPAPGNHDWSLPSGLSPYTDYFTLPGNERYYEVPRGLVHLFIVDSDKHEPDGNTAESRQGRWLMERLAASTACFKFVFVHHPPFSSSAHGSSEHMRWPFQAWGADAVFAGHDHTYERLAADGIPYFVDGLGGADRYEFRATAVPESQFRYNATHGAMQVTATETGVEFEFRDVADRVVDRLRVDKVCAGAAP